LRYSGSGASRSVRAMRPKRRGGEKHPGAQFGSESAQRVAVEQMLKQSGGRTMTVNELREIAQNLSEKPHLADLEEVRVLAGAVLAFFNGRPVHEVARMFDNPNR
jgi:hypothetical protein